MGILTFVTCLRIQLFVNNSVDLLFIFVDGVGGDDKIGHY